MSLSQSWKSSVISISSTVKNTIQNATGIDDNIDKRVEEPVTDTCLVPFDGWFAFCFGITSSKAAITPTSCKCTLLIRTLSASSLLSAQSLPGETCFASSDHVTTMPNSNTANVVEIQLPLRLVHNTMHRSKRSYDDDDCPEYIQKATTLSDINVGHLLYLSKGCCLNVQLTAISACNIESNIAPTLKSPGERNLDDVSIATKSAEIVVASHHHHEATVQWCILHFPHEPLPAVVDLQSSTNKDALIVPVGTLSTRNKALVCRICCKSFSTLRGIQNHIGSSHSSVNPSCEDAIEQQLHNENCQGQRCRSPNNSNDDKSVGSDVHRGTVPPQSMDTSIYNTPLDVLYQDAYMAIINKPQGMTVMGARPSLMRCDLLMSLVCTNHEKAQLIGDGANPDKVLGKPRPVHRLDNATGGILVIAKTHRSDQKLRISFMNRLCRKRYRAVLMGKLVLSENDTLPPFVTLVNQSSDDDNRMCYNCDATIDANIDGKVSQTHVRIVRYVQRKQIPQQDIDDATTVCTCWFTVVDLWPVTGRQHQLRKHMKLIGFSIYGDHRYISSRSPSSMPCHHCCHPGTPTTHCHNNRDAWHHMVPNQPHTVVARSSALSVLCLWAVEITIPHPYTDKLMTFHVPNEDDVLEKVCLS
jgi:23S rRNA-/tRNA-specific pseudouridylate synthase